MAALVRLDLCVLADPRLGDAAGDCHAAGLAALARLGYRIGVLAVASDAIGADTGALSPAWAALLDGGQVTRLAPTARVAARVALALDSRLFAHDLRKAFSLTADLAMVTVDRPLHLSGLTARAMDQIAVRARAVFGGPVTWAPGTVLARDALAHLAPHWPLSVTDWPLAVPDVARAPLQHVQRSRPVAGVARLARVRGALDEVPQAWLDDPRIAWRLRLGPGAPRPPWPQRAPVELWPDTSLDMADFLARIDALVLQDDPAEDPCPPEVLLALAAGVVPVLDPEYRPVFGAAALYALPHEVPDRLIALHEDPALRAETRAAGKRLLQRLHQPQDFAQRLAGLIGPPRADAFAPAILTRPPRRVLFYSSNGIGMGHLTRQLAIARRLPPGISPVFVSHSQAVDVVRGFGFPGEHLPYHATYGQNRAHWNAALDERLDAAMAFWRPSALVYDGNIPFPGLLVALDQRPEVGRVWVRRGLWGPDRDLDMLEASPAFDLILEPGEPADAFDTGPTAKRPGETLVVPPIRLLDQAEGLSRAEACASLGLNAEAVNVLVSPGSGNNAPTGALTDAVLAALAGRPGIGVVLAEWRIATKTQTLPPGVVRQYDYPFSRHLAAFDFAIAAAGYNTFAEHLAAGLPTIWLPNEAPEQDQQILRARFASETGLGLTLRLTEGFSLRAALEDMLAPASRAAFAEAGRRYALSHMAENGAVAAAAALAAICDMVPSRAPLLEEDEEPAPEEPDPLDEALGAETDLTPGADAMDPARATAKQTSLTRRL
jgi:UDP:flavonoid glycosyltransferase YjiC (YdhE family)